MNEGKYVFTQVLSFLPRQIFSRLVKKYKGDYRTREFNCSNQLRYLLFGQLTTCNSLRDICLCLKVHKKFYMDLALRLPYMNQHCLGQMKPETIEFLKDLD